MADRLKNSTLPGAVSDVVADLADLVQKEVRLARVELSDKISAKLHAGIWMAVAGGIGAIAGLLVVEALVFGISNATGLALHWSCLIVAGALAVIGAAAFAKGQADAREELTPTRTMHQIKADVATVKEQFS